ncbi:MAG: MFS transporter [Clostridiaceae bacterium]
MDHIEKKYTKLMRYLVLINACMSTFMSTLDGGIVNIILPVVAGNFSVNINEVQWVVTAYLLTISALLLIWGRISDLYGRKYLFAAGMAVFTIGSFMCGMSGSFEALVFSRVVQALGASIMMALVQGIVTSVFPENERGKALGFIGMVVALGSLTGPSLGGILVHAFSWQSVFFINIPFGIIGVILTFLVMPENELLDKKGAFDYKGTAVFVSCILLFFISLLNLQQGTIAPVIAAGLLILALILFILFVGYERETESPLVDFNLFKNRIFSMGLICAYLSFCSMFAYVFFMPFYLQYALGMTALHSGLMMSLYPMTMALVAPLSGWLSDKITYRPLTVAGLSVSTAGLLLMSTLGLDSSRLLIGAGIVILGAGNSIFQSPNNSSVMGAAPKEKLGTAGSLNSFFRNLGMVSGTTISVILFAIVTQISIESSTRDLALFLKGYHAVMLFAALLCLCAVFISIKRIRSKA